ncbi:MULTISPECIES: hypothetical protein [unclassified Streptomyces]|uniref:hypothetical protein n=1 Tax=unclassified Streptomyces TaxID=2593676 RepID=UPI00338E03A6
MPHAVLAELYDVDRSTISAAIRDVRSRLAVLTSNTAPHHPSGTPTGTRSGGSTPASLRAERHPAAGPERTRRAAAPGTPTSRGEVGFSELAKHERGRPGGGLGTRFPSPPTTGHGAPDSAVSAAVGPSGRPMKRPHIERRRGRR